MITPMSLAMGGNGKVLLNGHLYNMRFWGNKYQIEFAEQLRDILENNQQANQTKKHNLQFDKS